MRFLRTLDIPEAIKTREREKLNRERRRQQIGIPKSLDSELEKLPSLPSKLDLDLHANAKKIAQRAKSAGLIKTRPTLDDLRREGIIP